MKIISFQGLQEKAGTSTICAAIAYDLSILGHCVLCLDADLSHRHSILECIFNVDHQDIGYFQVASENKSVDDYPMYCIDKCNLLPRGTVNTTDTKAQILGIKNCLEMLAQLRGVDYVLMDTGSRRHECAKEASLHSDLVFTVASPDANTLIRLDECEFAAKEFIVLNKLLNNSAVMRDVCLMLEHSAISGHILREKITFDESVMRSLLKRQPFNRFMPYSRASADIRRLSFKLIDMCHRLDEKED